MSQTVQSSFSNSCLVDDCTNIIISCGNRAYNNAVYGVNQPIDYFSFIKSKAGINYDCGLDVLNNAVANLATIPNTPRNQSVNNINNTTIINQDAWDSIAW